MKKTVYILFILLIICFSSQAQSVYSIVLDSMEDGAKLYFNSGQPIRFKAKANITTGYSWSVGFNKKHVRLIKEYYVSDTVPVGWVGGGGNNYFDFELLSPGQSTLSFEYARGKDRASYKTITIVNLPLDKVSLKGKWFQTAYKELVVRDGVEYPYDTTYTQGEHSFIFKSNQTGISSDFNTETGLIEESPFRWTLKKNLLTIQYIVGRDVQDPLPQVYVVSPNIKGVILESMNKDDDYNFVSTRLVLER